MSGCRGWEVTHVRRGGNGGRSSPFLSWLHIAEKLNKKLKVLKPSAYGDFQ